MASRSLDIPDSRVRSVSRHEFASRECKPRSSNFSILVGALRARKARNLMGLTFVRYFELNASAPYRIFGRARHVRVKSRHVRCGSQSLLWAKGGLSGRGGFMMCFSAR